MMLNSLIIEAGCYQEVVTHLVPGIKQHYIISGQIGLGEITRNLFSLEIKCNVQPQNTDNSGKHGIR